MHERPGSRVRLALLHLVMLAALPACERGCLMKMAREQGVVPSASGQTPVARGQDCPPDLLRCQRGSISRSVGGFVPESCTGSVERCACPWTPAGQCAAGCAKDDLEIALVADAGSTQVCAAAPAAVVGGALPDDVQCDDDGDIVCRKDVVLRCGRPLRLLATCTQGCAVTELPAEVEDRAAIMLACKR
jgi:hypothetical protein